ncbi:Pantothenate kinase [Hondaea fermentalgiana]|uniref:Pantothenate kinase n=1 Tax=Hondaea fermentalgiana TaxID=2315210 RepID=A0A2R5G8K7_9STRA|nr:Pantothenate kinase [Hondaea fermentalgiana]|eukprot:GBG26875.1 Pantothenate kinase [Hondaea fermentalgiana]
MAVRENGQVSSGLDVGGTLAKAVIFVPEGHPQSAALHETLADIAWVEDDMRMPAIGGHLIFLKYLSSHANQAWRNVRKHDLLPRGSRVDATGGGAFKILDESMQRLGLKLHRHDEMESLMRGLLLMALVPGEAFSLRNILFKGARGPARERIETQPVQLDASAGTGFLVVNIGSGVSFVHCTKDSFERVGGSSLGGSTFLGLTALLTGEDSFDRAIDLAANGDSARVDMLVRDIYGAGKEVYGLKGTTLASSFGKMISRKNRAAARPEDIALSTLIMCSMNVAALAHLHAKTRGTRHIVFTGSFLARSGRTFKRQDEAWQHSTSELHLHKRNSIAMRTLAYAVSFWSKGERSAVFFRHEGFLGALGALTHAGVTVEHAGMPVEQPHVSEASALLSKV